MERLRAIGSWATTAMVTFGLAVVIVLTNHVPSPVPLSAASTPVTIITMQHRNSAAHVMPVPRAPLGAALRQDATKQRPTPPVAIKTVDEGPKTTTTSTTTTTTATTTSTTTTVFAALSPSTTTTRPVAGGSQGQSDDGSGGYDS